MVASNVLLPTIQGHHHTPVLCPRLEQCILTLLAIGGQGVRSLQSGTSPGWSVPHVVLQKTHKYSRNWAITGAHPHTTHTHTHTPTPTCPGIQSEDTIYTRVYSVFVLAFKARTNLCITHSKWGHFSHTSEHAWHVQREDYVHTPLHPYYERVRTVHIVTKRGLKFWPRFVKMSSLWM